MFCAECKQKFSEFSHWKVFDAGCNRWFCSTLCLHKWNEQQNRIRAKRRKEAQIQREQQPIKRWMQ